MARSEAAHELAAVATRHHVLSFQTAPEEEVEYETYDREEYQRNDPCQGAYRITILLEHDADTAYDRYDISCRYNHQYPIVDRCHAGSFN